jgi:hypothetical protein
VNIDVWGDHHQLGVGVSPRGQVSRPNFDSGNMEIECAIIKARAATALIHSHAQAFAAIHCT